MKTKIIDAMSIFWFLNCKYHIVVKKDGTVWGTGYNTYGLLGRWSGIYRGTSNSRYKTALNWVECPELEI